MDMLYDKVPSADGKAGVSCERQTTFLSAQFSKEGFATWIFKSQVLHSVAVLVPT